MIQFPDIGPTTDLKDARDRLDAYADDWQREHDRRAALTSEQRLAEYLNFRYTREPGEAWYYEHGDWTKPEHRRWLDKATALLRECDGDEAKARRVAALVR